MKKIIAAISLCILSATVYSAELVMPIRSVTDGDTIRSSLKLPCPLCDVSVRILGIDTPESNYLAKCAAEKAKGIAAKEFVKSLAAGQSVMILTNFKWDKYGGRIDAYVVINGVNVGQALIDRGLAKPYSGLGPRPDWCN